MHVNITWKLSLLNKCSIFRFSISLKLELECFPEKHLSTSTSLKNLQSTRQFSCFSWWHTKLLPECRNWRPSLPWLQLAEQLQTSDKSVVHACTPTQMYSAIYSESKQRSSLTGIYNWQWPMGYMLWVLTLTSYLLRKYLSLKCIQIMTNHYLKEFTCTTPWPLQHTTRF